MILAAEKKSSTRYNKPFERTRCDDGAFPVTTVARAAQGQRLDCLKPNDANPVLLSS